MATATLCDNCSLDQKKIFVLIAVKIIGAGENWYKFVIIVVLVHKKTNVSIVEIITGVEELWQGYVTIAHLEVKVINVSNAVNMFGDIQKISKWD